MNDLLFNLRNRRNSPGISDYILFFLFPVLCFYLNMLTMFDSFWETRLKTELVNIFFYAVFLVLLFLLFNKAKTAIRLELFLVWILGIANAYVYSFRRSYIRPWDLTSVGTAANVAGNYDYTPGPRMILSFVVLLILLFAASFCRLEADRLFDSSKLPRILGSLGCILIISFTTLLAQRNTVKDMLEIYTTFFDSKGMMKKNGMALNFMYQMKYLKVEKPKGYSKKDEEEILSSYSEELKTPERLPDIIVIMDEAFSDPAVDGEFSTNEDYMPFIHSLEKGYDNTVTGYLNVSVNGGNTPNTEFEFLTGNSLGFLPEGSIAFQQYVRHPIDSIPYFLKEFGYQTFASHPYKASGWDRPRVYPLLGFDEMYFKEYFEERDPELVRNYISDSSYFEALSSLTDEYAGRGPVFSFNVTMQNHSSYSKKEYDNFERLISVDVPEEKKEDALEMDNYLSLIRYSDDAFKELIEAYKDKERDTLIVFFGDHQPEAATFDVMWEENGKYWDDLDTEDYVNTYRVPFVIWANYDIEEMSGLETSANYLGNLVLKEAGFSLPPYRAFLEDYSGDYPVVSAVRYVDKNKSSVLYEDWDDSLIDYQKMQYYRMFDSPEPKGR
ncbi:MAG: LTA synthase family protein [Lachnospiraceae bacterium]|nr:LTA synthase family protein [Lachnospiraceae bacterium]